VPGLFLASPANLAGERVKPVKALADEYGDAIHYGERRRYAIMWRLNRLLPDGLAIPGIQTVNLIPACQVQAAIDNARGTAVSSTRGIVFTLGWEFRRPDQLP
jgi:hypothetical protein